MLKKKDSIFFIVLIILVIALIVSIETAGFSNNPFSKPSESLAVKRVIEFVKTQHLNKSEIRNSKFETIPKSKCSKYPPPPISSPSQREGEE